MTGRRYYITTLADWHRHAHRFANSHWFALSDAADAIGSRELAAASCAVPDVGANTSACDAIVPDVLNATRILVLVDADEGVHLALDDDAAFEALPHPFAPKPISHAAHEALAAYGVTPGATTFDAAEAVARAHPLLRPRVF
jgi:hypothetical protein